MRGSTPTRLETPVIGSTTPEPHDNPAERRRRVIRRRKPSEPAHSLSHSGRQSATPSRKNRWREIVSDHFLHPATAPRRKAARALRRQGPCRNTLAGCISRQPPKSVVCRKHTPPSLCCHVRRPPLLKRPPPGRASLHSGRPCAPLPWNYARRAVENIYGDARRRGLLRTPPAELR